VIENGPGSIVVVVVGVVVVVVVGLLISTAVSPMHGCPPALPEQVCQPRDEVQPVVDVNSVLDKSSVPSSFRDADST